MAERLEHERVVDRPDEHLRQPLVVGCLEHRQVEHVVLVEHARIASRSPPDAACAAAAKSASAAVSRSSWSGVARTAASSAAMASSRPRSCVEVVDVGHRQRAHPGAAVRLEAHEALGLEHPQRLTDGGARELQLLGEALLDEPLAGSQATLDDPPADLVVRIHPVGQGHGAHGTGRRKRGR